MPTNHDETLHERYAREYQTELAIYARMTPEQISDMATELHNALAARDAALAELAALKGGREPVAFTSERKLADMNAIGVSSIWPKRIASDGDIALYTAPPAQASAWVPEGLTAITRSMGRAIVRFKTTEQLNAFYRSMKSAIAAPTPGASSQ